MLRNVLLQFGSVALIDPADLFKPYAKAPVFGPLLTRPLKI